MNKKYLHGELGDISVEDFKELCKDMNVSYDFGEYIEDACYAYNELRKDFDISTSLNFVITSAKFVKIAKTIKNKNRKD